MSERENIQRSPMEPVPACSIPAAWPPPWLAETAAESSSPPLPTAAEMSKPAGPAVASDPLPTDPQDDGREVIASPPSCPKCGSFDLWQTVVGNWRCQHCDIAAWRRSRSLLELRGTIAADRGDGPRREAGDRSKRAGTCPEANMTTERTQNGKLGGCESKSKPTFALTLQAVPGWGDVPATIRLKRFLKAALRSYGLRCTECREHAPPWRCRRTARTSTRCRRVARRGRIRRANMIINHGARPVFPGGNRIRWKNVASPVAFSEGIPIMTLVVDCIGAIKGLETLTCGFLRWFPENRPWAVVSVRVTKRRSA